MAPLVNNMVPAKGTAFYVGSWVFFGNGSGGFDSCLIDPSAPEASEAARRREIDNFMDQLDEVELPVYIHQIRNQPDFNVSIPKPLSEMEEDPNKLLVSPDKKPSLIERLPCLNANRTSFKQSYQST